jgi:DNA-binding transcriptional MerR regulator/quercetin dioxygenase-like cupin family protein
LTIVPSPPANAKALKSKSVTTYSATSYLKIGDVARLVGVSPSAIRTWESLGLARPQRTDSKYRLYTQADVKLLKRAKYLRKVRGLNGPAIVQMLKGQSGTRAPKDGTSSAIGARLRQLREQRKLPLGKVARAVGISVGFLSSIERSHMSASIATLRKLAQFYKSNILEFFNPEESHSPLVRPKARKVLEVAKGVWMELLAVGHPVMEAHMFRLAPGAGTEESYTHAGEEFLYVLRGEFTIWLVDEEYRLKTGDSFYFESTTPHRWSNPGKGEAQVLWINTPPTF